MSDTSSSRWVPGKKLAMSLWDFSWYTRAAPGEPFSDLDRAFVEASERGYNCVRICAAPLLLFGDHDLDPTRLDIVPMGGGVGDRTRWYDVSGFEGLDLRARLSELFDSARRHGFTIILSSWEYQQSPAFASTADWHEMITAIDPEKRHMALAKAWSRMLDELIAEGHRDTIAYVELHNEVDLSRLKDVGSAEENTYWAQRPYIAAALDWLQEQHPDVLSTISYGITPYLDMGSVPDNAQIAHMHVYVYGVLGALEQWAQVRAPAPIFPSAEMRSLIRDDAPAFEDWSHAIEPWRLEATGISPSMFYAYDWVDPVRWDAWLYRHYSAHEEAMIQAAKHRLLATKIWADHHGVPAVIGEGWIGYTPLEAEFEDGPVGQYFAERVVDAAIDLGFDGLLVGSNSAPHHPGWANVAFQNRLNARIKGE